MKRILSYIFLCCAAIATANAQILVRLTGQQYAEQIMSLPSCKGIKYMMPHTDSTFISVQYDTAAVSQGVMLETLKALDCVMIAAPDMSFRVSIPERSYEKALFQTPQRSVTRSADGPYPNDPMFDRQWALKAINMPQLWQVPLKPEAKRPVIAIIDTGVDIDHPDLKDNIWTNEAELYGLPGVDDDGNGYIDDIHGWDFLNSDADVCDTVGHGTHCAGIAAAVTHNGIGIAGADPNAVIMPVKLFEHDRYVSNEELFQVLDYAVSNGADIVSMSFGATLSMDGKYVTDKLQLLGNVLSVFSERAILVAAAGNDGLPISAAASDMAAQPSVIGVENTTESGNLHFSSNYDDDLGPWASSWEGGYNYELSAPGTNILSTLPGGDYDRLTGTSMSTPLVAGVISRLISVKDYGSRQELVHDLISSRGRHFGPIDAMAAYTGVLSRQISILLPKTCLTVFDNECTLPFTVLNETDSALTDLCLKAEFANPDDAMKVRLYPGEIPIPMLEPNDNGVSLSITCRVDGAVPEDECPVSFSVCQGGQVIWSGIYNMAFYRLKYDSDSLSFAVLDPIRHTAQIVDYCGHAKVLNLPDTVVLDSQKMAVVSIAPETFMGRQFCQVNIPQTIRSIGQGAFRNCASLESIVLPTGLDSVNAYVFADCGSLVSVSIPGSIPLIGTSAFANCTSLESVQLGEGLKYIRIYAFETCRTLPSVVIPLSVDTIESRAFFYCNSLNSVTCLSPVPPVVYNTDPITDLDAYLEEEALGFEAFFRDEYDTKEEYQAALARYLEDVMRIIVKESGLGIDDGESTLYVPKGSADVYRNTPGWSLFGTILEFDPTPVIPVPAVSSPYMEYPLNRHIIIRDGHKYLKFQK